MKQPLQTELPVESSVHVEDFGSADYLALCARAKAGEIKIYVVARSRIKLWRVQYEIIKTPEATTEPTLTPKPEHFVEVDLLTVEPKHRMQFL